MDEIDNEGLLKSLELFVDRFPEQTAQYSVGVADKLVRSDWIQSPYKSLLIMAIIGTNLHPLGRWRA